MKKPLAALAVTAGFATLIAGASIAAKPLSAGNDPLAFAQTVYVRGNLVEQQSRPRFDPDPLAEWRNECAANPGVCVNNPTPCLWSADDGATFDAAGTLADGETAGQTQCVVADGFQHLTGVWVTSTKPDLAVTVDYQPQNVQFTVAAVGSGHDWSYRNCFVGPYYGGWTNLPIIPDSNNGTGIQTDVTVSVSNTTGAKVRNVSAQFVVGSSEPGRQSTYCQGGDVGEAFSLGGATWQKGGL